MTFHKFFAAAALLPGGWAENVLFEVDGGGSFTAVTANAAAGGAPRAKGPVLPGMPNLHSHAFQRAMAGLAEHAASGRSEEHTSELPSLMRISYAVFCLKKKTKSTKHKASNKINDNNDQK